MKKRFKDASTKWLLNLLYVHCGDPKVVKPKAVRLAMRELKARGCEDLFPAGIIEVPS